MLEEYGFLMMLFLGMVFIGYYRKAFAFVLIAGAGFLFLAVQATETALTVIFAVTALALFISALREVFI